MIKWSELGCETYSGCGRIEFGNNRLAGHRNAKLYSGFSCDLTVYQSGGKNLKNAREDQGGMNEYLLSEEDFSLSLPLTFLTSCGNRWEDRKEDYNLDGVINSYNIDALKREIC